MIRRAFWRLSSRHVVSRFRHRSLAVLLLAWAATPNTLAAPSGADAILAAMAGGPEEPLRQVAREALERRPAIARARAVAAAAAARIPQMAALPDPMASLQLFLLPPETRVGPQQVALSLSQNLPWFGKLELREQAAVYAAAMARAHLEALRLETVTEVRRLFYELTFAQTQSMVVAREREHLIRHEEAARARYTAGLGLQQDVLRAQAEITRSEEHQVAVEARRRRLLAALNALRDRPPTENVLGTVLPDLEARPLDYEHLLAAALRHRPEVLAAEAEKARAGSQVELARKNYFPDLTLGLGFTRVERRQDAAGRLSPPEGNGDDVLALSASTSLPVRRGRLAAGLEEALALESAAAAGREEVEVAIRRDLGDLTSRLPLLFQQRRLFRDVLVAQAEEALASAEAGYTTGKLSALDLLDAEHVLFEVRIAAARLEADLAIEWSRLEGVVGTPLQDHPEPGALPETNAP